MHEYAAQNRVAVCINISVNDHLVHHKDNITNIVCPEILWTAEIIILILTFFLCVETNINSMSIYYLYGSLMQSLYSKIRSNPNIA